MVPWYTANEKVVGRILSPPPSPPPLSFFFPLPHLVHEMSGGALLGACHSPLPPPSFLPPSSSQPPLSFSLSLSLSLSLSTLPFIGFFLRLPCHLIGCQDNKEDKTEEVTRKKGRGEEEERGGRSSFFSFLFLSLSLSPLPPPLLLLLIPPERERERERPKQLTRQASLLLFSWKKQSGDGGRDAFSLLLLLFPPFSSLFSFSPPFSLLP